MLCCLMGSVILFIVSGLCRKVMICLELVGSLKLVKGLVLSRCCRCSVFCMMVVKW